MNRVRDECQVVNSLWLISTIIVVILATKFAAKWQQNKTKVEQTSDKYHRMILLKIKKTLTNVLVRQKQLQVVF